MEQTLTNANPSENEKIKTHHARIVVNGTADKPYYSIEWFDTAKQEYYLGYSSYCIDNVLGWLKECFEIVEAPKTNADRIRAMSDEELADVVRCPHTGNWDLCVDDCKNCRIKWLKQPADMRGEEDG